MKLLVCGTRGAICDPVKFLELIEELNPTHVIEGCCPDSPDSWCHDLLDEKLLVHYPATDKNYLSRNLEMLEACDCVLAYHDKWSYGTAHVIANAVRLGKPVRVIEVQKVK